VPSLVVFGEVLFDCFPDGKRILGGAPFNVAWGLQGMGNEPVLVSAVGDDEDGRVILDAMRGWGMNTGGLTVDPARATGTVNVTFHDGEPAYDICFPRAWDFISAPAAPATRLLYHGSLALRHEASRAAFEKLRAQSSALRFFDVNLRPPHTPVDTVRELVRDADWLKLNIHELEAITGQRDLVFFDDATAAAVEHLRADMNVANVILTGGGDGAIIAGPSGIARQIPAPPKKVFVDAVGAGDAFSAAVIHGILRDEPRDAMIQRASLFAARVCGLRGATTHNPEFYTT
jgi:fructokinase